MARIGSFDNTLLPKSWYDDALTPEGFFDVNLEQAAAASGSSGAVNVTLANDALSASGKTVIIGSLTRTLGNDTSSASGTPVVTGTLARTLSNDTISATGTPVVSSTLAVTLASDTCNATGETGSSAVTGTVDVSLSGDTLSATGTAQAQQRPSGGGSYPYHYHSQPARKKKKKAKEIVKEAIQEAEDKPVQQKIIIFNDAKNKLDKLGVLSSDIKYAIIDSNNLQKQQNRHKLIKTILLMAA